MILTNRLSIQSKLILMFLGVSIGSILVISALGYANSKSALTTSIYNQLTGIRVSKANLVQSQLSSLRNQVITLAENGSVLNAMRDFRASWKDLDDKVVERAMDDKIRSFYETVFLPQLAPNIEGELVLETYLPHLIPSRYLQYFYVAKNPNPYESGQKFHAADDGSSYSAAHKNTTRSSRGRPSGSRSKT